VRGRTLDGALPLLVRLIIGGRMVNVTLPEPPRRGEIIELRDGTRVVPAGTSRRFAAAVVKAFTAIRTRKNAGSKA
jgi:hypothetical protein